MLCVHTHLCFEWCRLGYEPVSVTIKWWLFALVWWHSLVVVVFCWFCCVLRANYQANGEFIRCVFVWINSPHPLETKRHSTVQKAFFALCKAFYPFTKNYLQQQQQQQQKTYTYVRKKGIHLFDVSYEHFWKLQFSIVAIAVWINTHKNGRVP